MVYNPTLWWVFDKGNKRHDFKTKRDAIEWTHTEKKKDPKAHFHIYDNDMKSGYRCKTMKERGKYWR